MNPIKQGQNEKCQCGSGKKYKKCCKLKSDSLTSGKQFLNPKNGTDPDCPDYTTFIKDPTKKVKTINDLCDCLYPTLKDNLKDNVLEHCIHNPCKRLQYN